MLRRTMDATFLNEVANHPVVRPWLGGEGPLDLTAAVENPANYALVTEHGGYLFHPLLPGVYEVHTMFLPSGHGSHQRRAAAEAFRYLFAITDCLEIVTKCPDDNAPARLASSALGFRERFRRADAWAPGVGVSYRVFSVDDWFVRSGACLLAGRDFHDTLESAKAAAGSPLDAHPQDEAHDRAVGAAALMIMGGQTTKGVAFYNRWAVFSGYQPIEVVAQDVVDVVDAVVEARDGRMHVLLVRQERPPAP